VFLEKRIAKHIFVYIETKRDDLVYITHQAQREIYYTPDRIAQIENESTVRSEHHRRPQKCLYAVRPCSAFKKPIISEPGVSSPSHLETHGVNLFKYHNGLNALTTSFNCARVFLHKSGYADTKCVNVVS